jgi:hypothetical protein
MTEVLTEFGDVPSLEPFADSFSVGEASLALITRMRQPVEPGQEPSRELLVGDVLRRTCRIGGTACAGEGCQMRTAEEFDNFSRLCSDLNLRDVTQNRLGIQPENLLMVGVTADSVGFYDELASYTGQTNTNSVGIRELPGFNAFFARASESVALGARLADCGFAAIEFKDSEGESVIGFAHLTRPNLQGESKLGFEVNGQPAGSFGYFLHKALEHYGGDISSVKVRLAAAIKGENFRRTFQSAEKGPEKYFPGWLEQGFLSNVSNPNWQPGDDINPEDIWEPRYREMIRWQIMRSGIEPSQLDETGTIDPADLEGGHASNQAGKHDKTIPEARDAYFVTPRSLHPQLR